MAPPPPSHLLPICPILFSIIHCLLALDFLVLLTLLTNAVYIYRLLTGTLLLG